MPQSYSWLHVHLVFATKGRAPMIQPEIRDELHRYLSGIAKNIGCPAIRVGGTEDHVHILFS